MLEEEGQKHPSMDYKVLYYEKSMLDRTIVKFDPNGSLHAGQCFITKVYPQNQGTASRRLGEIMGSLPNSRIDFYCYDYSLDPDHLIDITEWFWKEYVKSGRCVFDREHTGLWQGDENRYTQINRNSRKCNWCGQHQKRSIEKVINTTRKEVWTA